MARVAVIPEEQRGLVPEVVERYLAGESLHEVAKDLRVDRRKLYDWMFTELGGEAYRELVTRCLVARVADADGDLEAANDLVKISKAREAAKFARMDLERRRPALYGVKQEVKHLTVPVLNIVLLDRPSELGQPSDARVVDVTPVAVLGGEVVDGALTGEVDGLQKREG